MVNLIQNGEFTNDISGWNAYPLTMGTPTRFIYTDSVGNNWPVARITMLQSGVGFQFSQYGFPIVAGATYKLDFDARCNTGHGFDVTIIQHNSPYTNLGLTQTLSVSTTWSHYTYTFTASVSESNSRLMFWFSQAVIGDLYDIDAVVLEMTSIPPSLTYDCVANQCVPNTAGTGQYSSLSLCQSACVASSLTYDCVANQCVPNTAGTGQYLTLPECQASGCGILPPASKIPYKWIFGGLFAGMFLSSLFKKKHKQ